MPVPSPSARLWRWLRRHEIGTLTGIFGIASGLVVFLAVAEEVREGDTVALDRAILLALRNPNDLADPIGGHWIEEMARDMTALGGVAMLTLLTLAVLGYLLLLRKPRAAVLLLGSVLGALLVAQSLKGLFERPRPDLVPQFSYVVTSSFPSGHSMLSAAVYLTLGTLLARLHESRLLKLYVIAWALLLSCLVGVSRVYVGVHWPTDVIAGWAAGTAWAAACSLLARGLQARGDVEPPSRTPDIQ